MHSAVYLVATINCSAVLWVGFFSKITEHAGRILDAMASPLPRYSVISMIIFVPEIILWRLAPMPLPKILATPLIVLVSYTLYCNWSSYLAIFRANQLTQETLNLS